MRQIGALTTYKKQFYGQQKKRFSVYHLAVICHYVQVLLPMLSSILEQHRVQKQFLIYKIPPNLTDGKKVFISMSYSTTGLKVSFMALSHSRPLRERRQRTSQQKTITSKQYGGRTFNAAKWLKFQCKPSKLTQKNRGSFQKTNKMLKKRFNYYLFIF